MLNFVVLARGDWSERYDFHVGVRIKDYPAGTVETRSAGSSVEKEYMEGKSPLKVS